MQTHVAALTASNTSAALRVQKPGEYFVEITGTFNSGTVTLTYCPSESGTYVTLNDNGSNVAWSAVGHKLLDLMSGYYKFVAANVTTVAIKYEEKKRA